MPISTFEPWAKLERDAAGNVRAALPLADHILDVAAAVEALFRGGAWRRALEQAAGRPLTNQDYARLAVLVALHDIGKANAGFQARRWGRAEKVGHTGQVAALLFDPQLAASTAGREILDLIHGWRAGQHFAAVMAHHGRPTDEFRRSKEPRTPPWLAHVKHWRPANGYDPVAEAARVLAQVRARWPLAWAPGPELPQSPRFVSLFAGLVVLADWLGSDARRFPVDGPYGIAREAIRAAAAGETVRVEGLVPLDTPAADFHAAFGFAPRGVQTDAAAADLGPVALIEAETGSGKTEAALWRWLELRRRGHVDGLYFALPTRSAAVQLHARIDRMLARVWGAYAPRAVLAVPGYLRAGDAEGEALPGFAVRWDDGENDGRWAAERTNRFLAARVAVGTIDQALLAALRVRHAPVRAAALARSLLVVDEVHASDAYMGGLLEQLLDNHVAAGGHALLLSATLGAVARARFLKEPVPGVREAVAQPYPALAGTEAPPRAASAVDGRSKAVRIELAGIIDAPDAIAARAIEAARAGASVLVVRNSVRGAVAVAQAVEAQAPDLAFRVNGVATLHHGRFAPSDRRLLDAAVETAFGTARTAQGRVLVGTQTLEQSLDIDADLLLTDLAPMDVLLQRIGRLHRHARDDRGAHADARTIILRPAERDLTPLLDTLTHGLGSTRTLHGAYPNLLHAEAVLRLFEAEPAIAIPADNRRLVEEALHPHALRDLAETLGTAWQNHAAACSALAYADRGSARDLALDLALPLADLIFPDTAESVATRLGAQDLLADFDPPFAGPFAGPDVPAVARIAIPAFLLGAVTPDDRPVLLEHDAEGQRFALGGRRYLYGRWGLRKLD